MKLAISLLLLLACASAVHITFFKSSHDCTGTSTVGSYPNGECVNSNGTSGLIECASATKDSTWRSRFFYKAACDGSPLIDQKGTGTDCSYITIAQYSIIVDCSAATGGVSGKAFVQLRGQNALKHVRDLTPSDEVLAADEQGQLVSDWVKNVLVVGTADGDEVEFVKIKLANGSKLLLAPEHNLILADGSRKAARDLTVSDYVLALNRNGDALEPQRVRKLKLKVKAAPRYVFETAKGHQLVVNGVVA